MSQIHEVTSFHGKTSKQSKSSGDSEENSGVFAYISWSRYRLFMGLYNLNDYLCHSCLTSGKRDLMFRKEKDMPFKTSEDDSILCTLVFTLCR